MKETKRKYYSIYLSQINSKYDQKHKDTISKISNEKLLHFYNVEQYYQICIVTNLKGLYALLLHIE